MKSVLRILSMFLVLGCIEKIVYVETPAVEIPADEEPVDSTEVVVVPSVGIGGIRSSTKYLNGIPFITANGFVTNSGPGSITSVRALLTSNHGYVRSISVRPSGLREGESGTWAVSGFQGTYIRFKEVLFSYDH